MSAAMNIVNQETARFVAQQARARYRLWREQVELFQVVEGVRAELIHVPDERWAEYFAANEDAYSAVVEELKRYE